MKIDIDVRKRYQRQFMVYNNKFHVGNGTEVEVMELDATVDSDKKGMMIIATVKLAAWVGLDKVHPCSCCDAVPPAPNDYDALWFILENHDGGRLVFPSPEGCNNERDCYPVTGWEKGPDGMVCPECQKELDEAAAAVRAKRKKK